MMMQTLAILAYLLAHGVPATHTDGMARCIADSGMPSVMLALAEVESGWRPRVRSKAGACGYWQLLGGRYGHSPCDRLIADPALACRETVEELRYWRRQCGASWLDAWNGGWRKCWARAHKGPRCKGERCRHFGRRVVKRAAEIDENMAWGVEFWAE
jgi:hypothetical protein